jgi:hypothetical protein
MFLTLPLFLAGIFLVDDVNAPFPPDHLAIRRFAPD